MQQIYAGATLLPRDAVLITLRAAGSARPRRIAARRGGQEAIELGNRFRFARPSQLAGLLDSRRKALGLVTRLPRRLQQALTQRHRLLDAPSSFFMSLDVHAMMTRLRS